MNDRIALPNGPAAPAPSGAQSSPIITRGGFLRGILAAGVAPAIIPVAEAHTVAGLRRGLALRQSMLSSSNGEEEMYKELFLKLCANTLSGEVVLPEEVEVKRTWLISIQPNMTSLTILAHGDLNGWKNPVYQTQGLTTVKIPNATRTWSSIFDQSGNNLTDVYLGNSISSFRTGGSEMFWGYGNRNVRIHIPKPHDEVMAIDRFPGLHANSNKDAISFHCSDGILAWNGTEWAFTANT